MFNLNRRLLTIFKSSVTASIALLYDKTAVYLIVRYTSETRYLFIISYYSLIIAIHYVTYNNCNQTWIHYHNNTKLLELKKFLILQMFDLKKYMFMQQIHIKLKYYIINRIIITKCIRLHLKNCNHHVYLTFDEIISIGFAYGTPTFSSNWPLNYHRLWADCFQHSI